MFTPERMINGWIDSALRCVRMGKLGTIVHVGARAGQWDFQQGSNWHGRLVLVQGEPQLAIELREEWAGHPQASVIEEIVAPESGQQVWYSCNLKRYSGLLAPTGLTEIMPRLSVDSGQVVQARALGLLIDQLLQESSEPARLLVIDQPGLETAMLSSLSEPQLHAFEWVLVRGVSDGWMAESERLDRALDFMARAHYMVVFDGIDADPGWPFALLRLNESARSMEREIRALKLSHESNSSVIRELNDSAAVRRDEIKAATESLAELTARLADREAKLADAAKVRDHAAQLESELADLHARQHVLCSEILKAEGQIEAIMSLMRLRQSG